MVHLTFNTITTSSSLAIIRDRNTFSNYSAKIEALFVAFLASRLIPAKAVDRFSAVYSISARSRV
jgi:hypothetical protein